MERSLPVLTFLMNIVCSALDKKSRHSNIFGALFIRKNAGIFLISQQKHMLWVLIRSALVRHF